VRQTVCQCDGAARSIRLGQFRIPRIPVDLQHATELCQMLMNVPALPILRKEVDHCRRRRSLPRSVIDRVGPEPSRSCSSSSPVQHWQRRVYGDAASSETDRNATTLAKWIVKENAKEVYVRHLQREVRLPGLKAADDIHEAAHALIEADWLREPPTGTKKNRARMAYPVNPKVLEIANGPVG